MGILRSFLEEAPSCHHPRIHVTPWVSLVKNWKLARKHCVGSHTFSKKRHQQFCGRARGVENWSPPLSLIWIIIVCLLGTLLRTQLPLLVIIISILLNYWAGRDYTAEPTVGKQRKESGFSFSRIILHRAWRTCIWHNRSRNVNKCLRFVIIVLLHC
jgi:hypothetical protein